MEFVPDAKALTDPPKNLTMLIKQRRRWMNGAMFGTGKVSTHFFSMIQCCNGHPMLRCFMMVLFMLYLISEFALSFMIVGATFSAVVILLSFTLRDIFLASNSAWLQKIADHNLPGELLFSTYLVMIILTVMISLSIPVDKGIGYFRFIGVVFGILMVLTVAGIIYFMVHTGFYAEQLKYNPGKNEYEPDGIYVFSWLTVAGVILLGVYLVPMVFRPIDFLRQPVKYLYGFVAYFLMMPMYLNVFTIYALCNLHDVSWGNRPASTGTEAFSAVKKEQEEAKATYMVYRTNFLIFWLCCQVGFYILVLQMMISYDSAEIINSGTFTYFVFFSCYVAALVLFACFWAFWYL